MFKLLEIINLNITMESNLKDNVSFSREICVLFAEKTMTDFVANIFLSPLENTGIDAEYELLHLNILREASELYFINASKSSCVCDNIANLSKIFNSEDSWNNMIIYLQRKTDKYLVFATSRTISAIMYNFPLLLFEQRLSFLIESVLKTTDNSRQNSLFELLTSLLDYSSKITYTVNRCQCANVVACTVSSPTDVFSCLCMSLCTYWNSFVDIFLERENPSINFLHLWKILSERNLSENLSSVFLNEDLAVNFLSIAFKLPPIALRLYADIITQIFCSSLKSGSWKCSEKKTLEESVTAAISGKCLDLLPLCEVSLTFCSPINRNQSMSQLELSKINITSKKIIFVIFNLLTEFTNVDSLCEVLDKVFEFIFTHSGTRKHGSTYCWIVDSFIEYDDLLFGVMFATLKIYCKLKEQDTRLQECNAKTGSFIKELNPHKTFIKFLQQIGWDHNELLSFLLSDETCCLVYLLSYLKLLLAEWTQFIEGHEFLFTEKYEQELLLKCTLSSSQKNIPIPGGHNSKLVLYSSSSSSDEDSGQLNAVDEKDEIGDYLKERASRTISILVNLKKSIQKLVDVKEFPYNVRPLMKLLRSCSDKRALLT